MDYTGSVIREKIRINHLGILVTTYCNLNCRNCADLIPKRERKHYKLRDIKNDLYRILEVVDFIEEILVIGGETLLYPDLKEVLDFCREQPKIGKIIITTNGTMMPEKALLDSLKRNGVLMRVSGYPEHIAPDRTEIINKYKEYGLETEDLDQMLWQDIGNEQKRGRSEEELKKVFGSCGMKTCVTINSDGKIFYCSRQMTADELSIYPNPKENEYVDVRNSNDLEQDFKDFYALSYISTCDYCDGISCATSRLVPTATQILNKTVFLELIEEYGILTADNCSGKEKEDVLNRIICTLDSNLENLNDFKETEQLVAALQEYIDVFTENAYNIFVNTLKNLLDAMISDYDFEISQQVPYGRQYKIPDGRNLIKIGLYPMDKNADILLAEKELWDAAYEKYPMDIFVYNRLFVESKLKRLEKEDIECIVSGLSYTQYGILEGQMPVSTVNLSVTGQDVPYSVLMARHALKRNPRVRTIVMPMTYYQGCYDMSDDDFLLHHHVVSRINVPVLNDARNFKGNIGKSGYCEGNPLKIYEVAADLNALRNLWEEKLTNDLMHMEFFNAMNLQAPFGGLRFDFRELPTEEGKFDSAKITASHNERICTKKGYLEVVKYLVPFLEEMREKGRKVIIFVPPMTEYLYQSYHKELRDFYYEKIVTLLNDYDNVTFADLAADESFMETDFCDFEHLNSNGANKLTKIIGTLCTENKR